MALLETKSGGDELPLPLSKADLLAALDAQIKFVGESQRNEGWTRWAIWGALAAICWKGTELFVTPEFVAAYSVLIAFAVFIGLMALESVIGLISPISRVVLSGQARFFVITDVESAVRPGVVASALRHILIILGLLFFHYPGLWPLWTYSLSSLLIDALAYIPVFGRLSFPSKLETRSLINVTEIIYLFWLIFVGLYVSLTILKNISFITLADVRFALLLNAAAYLLIRVSTATTSNHAWNELTELRQHLAFARMDTAEVQRQAEKILRGVKLDEVISPLVGNVLKESGELEQMILESNKKLADLHSLIVDNAGRPPSSSKTAKNRAEALRKIDDLDIEATRLNVKIKSLRRVNSHFVIRVFAIYMYSHASAPELTASIKKVQDASKSANENVKKFHNELKAIKLKLADHEWFTEAGRA